jgi:hypothetical protein
VVDNAYQKNDIDLIKDGLKTLRVLGVPVGLCSHMPEVILRAEREEWGAEWYMACVYNVMKKGHVSSSITGKFIPDETYDEADRKPMFDAIRAVTKPCMAFKILGATRRCTSDEDREAAFTEAYESIKPSDGCIVGFYQKDKDQILQNAAFVRKILGG